MSSSDTERSSRKSKSKGAIVTATSSADDVAAPDDVKVERTVLSSTILK